MKSTKLLSVVLSLIMFTGVTAGSAAFAESDDAIDSFEDCVEAGYPVMESYPEQCMTNDGTVYVNDEDDDETDEEDYDKYGDDYERDYDKHVDSEMRDKLERYCELSDEERDVYIAEHDKTSDHREKMDRFCSLDEDGRTDFIEEHRAEYIAHMKEKYSDKKHHMNYDRLCAMAESDRTAEITDVAKLDRINKWCDMTPEEREEYKRQHHDKMKDKMHDKTGMMHDKAMECGCHQGDDGAMQCPMMDANTDMQCSMMADKMHDKMGMMHDKMKHMGDSHRLKAMIMSKYDVSDERMDEIKMKYREKHGELSDDRKSELKMKFKNHMKMMKPHMTDERKAEIHDRLAEMRTFKAELRDKSSDLTDEQKQELRAEFIEKAKDLQLAWITPRTQMAAGIDAAEVECREGFSLVLKASNGVAMCLKADTALKMIDRGIVVPTN